ncbi:acyltransferase family protein [Armatimonas sp.]|uniref:acyltransferase family protein n=1 Tax=Armatimonas sp. TaxID=1872638 RepID=UPI003752D821
MRAYFPHLDGLRGLAALYVVAHHAFLLCAQAFPIRAKNSLADGLLYGHLAVDVFIVLSGFCLALPEKATAAKVFYLKRARRILPAYLAILAASVAHTLYWNGGPLDFRALGLHGLLLQDVFPETIVAFNQPLWSVAVEWKIYFLFPVLLCLLAKPRGTALVLATTAIIGYGLTRIFILSGKSVAELGHTCPWYVFLFGIGVCAGKLTSRWDGEQKRLMVLVLALLSGVLLVGLLFVFPMESAEADLARAFPVIDPAMGILTAACLALWHHRLPRLLTLRPVVFCGTIAYSIYLIHFPILEMLAKKVVKPLLPAASQELQTLALLGLGLPLVLGAAWVSWRLFEKPFQRSTSAKTSSRES